MTKCVFNCFFNYTFFFKNLFIQTRIADTYGGEIHHNLPSFLKTCCAHLSFFVMFLTSIFLAFHVTRVTLPTQDPNLLLKVQFSNLLHSSQSRDKTMSTCSYFVKLVQYSLSYCSSGQWDFYLKSYKGLVFTVIHVVS